MNKKIYIDTLGCPKNYEDSERFAGLLVKEGSEITSDPYSADFLIVNTCSFINDAKVESIDAIFELSHIKDETGAKLIVTGCLPQRYGKELFSDIPEVDHFLGVNNYSDLSKIIKMQDRTLNVSKEPEEKIKSRVTLGDSHYAYLKISEGCNNRCSYCSIPSIRGDYREENLEDIVKEGETLVEKGAKELIIIAQDTTKFKSLPHLINNLSQIEKLSWIRLMYCYEDEISDELINVIANNPKVCKYIDIPIQHISDNMLKAMNRRSTENSIKSTISKLRKEVPGIHIRTTFIVGFPGESQEDFEKLYNFIKDTRFERLGVFEYSKEEGTLAAEMDKQIDEDIKRIRLDSIMQMQRNISREKNESKIGKELEVIIDRLEDNESSPPCFIGRSQYDAPGIDEELIIPYQEGIKLGDIVKVKIIDAFDYDLIGQLL